MREASNPLSLKSALPRQRGARQGQSYILLCLCHHNALRYAGEDGYFLAATSSRPDWSGAIYPLRSADIHLAQNTQDK